MHTEFNRAASLILGIVLATVSAWATIPSAPVPPKLVNDYASMLTADEVLQLEDLLVAYDDTTSTQICVVIVNDLDGQDILQAAYEIGEQWGVGHDKFSNGVVLLIKNKTADSGGEIAIATGYGTEGALTDAISRRVIEQDITPCFREGDYFLGILNAVLHIQSILSGEDFGQQADDEVTPLDLILIVLFLFVLPVIIIVMLVRYAKKHPEKFNNYNNGSGGGFGSGSGGNWGGGGFNIGGGGFSGGGHSSFGGFGGGHFGGGGARGGW